jgi:Predicted signal transduction protein with a C-terminal ATPase domain
MNEKWRKLSFGSKIRVMLVTTALPLVILIAVLLGIFIKYNRQYDDTINNLTLASEFNVDFKSTIDSKMLQTINDRDSFITLDPLSDVADAREVITYLKENSTNDKSLTMLGYVDKYLDGLEEYMISLYQTKLVAEREEIMEGSIRIRTKLLEKQMQEYIYHETLLLAELREQTSKEITMVTITMGSASVLVIIGLLFIMIPTTRNLTRPLQELSENIRMVAEGDFTVRGVDSSDDEVQALSATFDHMVERISGLMKRVRQEEDNLRKTSFQLLQSQINPHFLYNTFDTIIWLTEDAQYDKVKQITLSMSNFYRVALSDGADIITLEEELQHVRSYLEIQKVRYNDIMEYEIDVDSALHDAVIPKLSLQPLVENALYHGIKNKRGGGCITISAKPDKRGFVVIRVRDSGKGMKPHELKTLREALGQNNKIGYGLSNVFERISLYFGGACECGINSEYGKFTEVTLRIPSKNNQQTSNDFTT